jgi:hypothetical protein
MDNRFFYFLGSIAAGIGLAVYLRSFALGLFLFSALMLSNAIIGSIIDKNEQRRYEREERADRAENKKRRNRKKSNEEDEDDDDGNEDRDLTKPFVTRWWGD